MMMDVNSETYGDMVTSEDDDEDWRSTNWVETSSTSTIASTDSINFTSEIKPSNNSGNSYNDDIITENEIPQISTNEPLRYPRHMTYIKAETLANMTKQNNVKANAVTLNTNKAGMEGLDKERINKIIYEASRGSKFHENELKKDADIRERIAKQKAVLESLSESHLAYSLIAADGLVDKLEERRDISRTIVHIDMDAFYAAVETRDDPALAHIPMAVGGTGMLSTSNYAARKFGVRAGMPGFIGKKLCPNLTIVPGNFEKYQIVSNEVKTILAEYDPNFCAMGLDEAYLDFTEHIQSREMCDLRNLTYVRRGHSDPQIADCKCDPNGHVRDVILSRFNWMNVSFLEKGTDQEGVLFETVVDDDMYVSGGECRVCKKKEPQYKMIVFGRCVNGAVQECRCRIEQRTQLTASAGISCNMLLAKVCSDYNKPDGQFYLTATKEAILEFVSTLPIRKVGGIGKVTEHMLTALGIYTCGDLYDKRALLHALYSDISFSYFMRVSRGLGTTRLSQDGDRKSKSVERTFRDTSDPQVLLEKCRELSQTLADDLTEERIVGKTVGIKIKTDKFQVKTKAQSVKEYTRDVDIIYKTARSLLEREMALCHPKLLCLRLLGIRMSGLVLETTCYNNQSIAALFKTQQKQLLSSQFGSTGIGDTAAIPGIHDINANSAKMENFNSANDGNMTSVIVEDDSVSNSYHIDKSHSVSARSVTNTPDDIKTQNNQDHADQSYFEEVNDSECQDKHVIDKSKDESLIKGQVFENDATQVPADLINSDTDDGLSVGLADKIISSTITHGVRNIEDSANQCVIAKDVCNSNGTHSLVGVENTSKQILSVSTKFNVSSIGSNSGSQFKNDSTKLTVNGLEPPTSLDEMKQSNFVCPVCYLEQRTLDLTEFNQHVDICLNRDVVRAIVSTENSQTADRKRAERPFGSRSESSGAMKKRKMSGPGKPTTRLTKPISSYFMS